MKEIWDKRYNTEDYAYGVVPNEYFAAELEKLMPGKILLPAEGEGRNAVHAAQKGWQVTAFDFSKIARQKALNLAYKKDVTFDYLQTDFDSFTTQLESFDCIALCYAHVGDGNRSKYHKRMVDYLKPGGTIILEAFSKNQINNNTGGPKNVEFLYSIEELKQDFSGLSFIKITELQTEIYEGKYHSGMSDIIRLTGRK
jgi:cyclopropane fatty-acyl-phospholipid synthase-like methyltransferase